MMIGTVTSVAKKSVFESSSVPINSSARHTAFHPDDFTHPCHPLYVHPSDILGASLVYSFRWYLQWQRCNDLVVSWLTNSLTKKISRSVEYSELAKDIWNELEERYGKAGASISVNHLSVCTCGGNKKAEEEEKVYQFLMGLNETYLQVRSNIIMLKPLPSMNIVYNILLSDEKYRQVSSASHFSSSSASFNVGIFIQKSALILLIKPGHTIEKCYKLHDFPPNFKFSKTTGPRKMAANTEVDKSGFLGSFGGSDDQPQSQSEQLSIVPGFTKEQYSQLMMLLQQSHLSSSSSTPNLLASANFAGELMPESGLFRTCLLIKIENILWIIDSEASDHMTSDKSLLFNIQTLPIPYLVSLPNGYKIKITNIGSLTLSPDLILHNVLYVPSFHYNLISVYKLVARPGHLV
ncbi:uncharacterized protein LOC142168238 [Nicotiana tabacum]|uniref:Uncharacterized protein LOC142168238 n=1 Tax=Nicotiana tabacum TaxID=4097 RepID=A0AC58SJ50_TOBAC